MTESQFACLTLTLVSLVVLVGYLLVRVASLQSQCNAFHMELCRMRAQRGYSRNGSATAVPPVHVVGGPRGRVGYSKHTRKDGR